MLAKVINPDESEQLEIRSSGSEIQKHRKNEKAVATKRRIATILKQTF